MINTFRQLKARQLRMIDSSDRRSSTNTSHVGFIIARSTLYSWIRQAAYGQLEHTIVFNPGNLPRPPELIATIAANIYDLWKDTANLRYRSTTEIRKPPFTTFRWITTPKLQPGAVLNPLKVGIVALWVMRGVLERQTWPGHIDARTWDSDLPCQRCKLEVGSLYITNLGTLSSSSVTDELEAAVSSDSSTPTAQPTGSIENRLPAPGATGSPNSGGSAFPVATGKRWLECFSQL